MLTLKMVLHVEETLETTIHEKLPKSYHRAKSNEQRAKRPVSLAFNSSWDY